MDAAPAFKRRKRPQGIVTPRDSPRDTPEATTLEAEQDEVDTTSETLEELLAIRALRRTTGGIELERLNAGERKRRKKTEQNDDAVAAEKERVRLELETSKSSILRSNNFTGQTNAIDVDKHMMAYIEDELRKRKGQSTSLDSESERRALDPREELYTIAAEYKVAKARTEEGNVQLSTAMLTAIPEVDLGIDIRLRNIQDTEKAKRVLFEEKSTKQDDEGQFAADRFYRARRPLESDVDALAKARKEAAEGPPPEVRKSTGPRKQTATDDQTMDRFKKRQHGRK